MIRVVYKRAPKADFVTFDARILFKAYHSSQKISHQVFDKLAREHLITMLEKVCKDFGFSFEVTDA